MSFLRSYECLKDVLLRSYECLKDVFLRFFECLKEVFLYVIHQQTPLNHIHGVWLEVLLKATVISLHLN